MVYLLDSNTLIEAKNHYYGFALCPGFWDWFEQQNRAGRVFSIDRVRTELRTSWRSGRPIVDRNSFFSSIRPRRTR